MRFVWAVCGLLILPSANIARATTIVVARTATEIVIGADSKVTDAFGNDVGRRACKIRQVGNLVVAFEGLEVDRQTGFDLQELTATALQLKPSASASDKVGILTGFIVSRLFAELSFLKHNAADTYNRKIEGGRVFLRIIVCAFETKRPLVFVRNFKATQIAAGQIGVVVGADDCLEDCHSEVATRFVGETEAIDGLPDETKGFWNEGLANGVRKLIETEIAARSEYVGPPIDMLRLDKNGAQWIQRKRECLEHPSRGKRPA